MWYVAFTLGFFGSLHCIGMCGPLAIAFTNKHANSKVSHLASSFAYNIGRALTYSFLGAIFGAFGTVLMLTNLQQWASIIFGIILILAFLLSIDLEFRINQNHVFKRFHHHVNQTLNKILQRSNGFSSFSLGIANGFLPCGLVYLAIAGSLTTGSIIGGMTYMFIFGIGTMPALTALILGSGSVQQKFRQPLRKIIPYVSLAFGIFLIIRGIRVDVPQSLDFWDMLKNPLMCH